MKFYINFYLHTVKKYNYLNLSVSCNGVRIKKNLELKVEKKYWDKKKQEFKPRYNYSTQANTILENFKSEINKFFYNHEMSMSIPDKKEINDFLQKLIKNQKEKKQTEKKVSLLKCFTMFIRSSENGDRRTSSGSMIKDNTINSYKSVLNHLKSFKEKTRYKMTFEDMNEKFSNKYSEFLNKNGVSNNSLSKDFKIIKTFLHWSADNGYHNNRRFIKELHVKPTDSNHIALTVSELEMVRKCNGLSDELDRVRDLFLVQIYTGVRVSELMRIKKHHIDTDNKTIQVYSEKTDETAYKPINKHLWKILEKYDLSLPLYTHQRYNKLIKQVCKAAEIDDLVEIKKQYGKKVTSEMVHKWETVSSHTARFTFITLSLKSKLLPEAVMKITGHKSREKFNKYVKASGVEAIDEVRNIWDLM